MEPDEVDTIKPNPVMKRDPKYNKAVSVGLVIYIAVVALTLTSIIPSYCYWITMGIFVTFLVIVIYINPKIEAKKMSDAGN